MNYEGIEFFHGSFIFFHDIDLSKSKPYRDFGPGFYITNIFEQAADWACKARKKAWIMDKSQFFDSDSLLDTYVYKYNLNICDHTLSIKEFNGYDEEWFDFVIKFRSDAAATTDYDIIIGPMADGEIYKIIKKYELKMISKADALEQLKFKYITNQVLIRSNKALACLSELTCSPRLL